MSGNTPIDQLADAADRIFSQLDHQTTPVHSAEAISDHRSLGKTVEDLQRQVRDLTLALESYGRSRFPSRRRFRSRPRSSSRNKDATSMCYYHRRFGSAAHHCTKPCNYTAVAENKTASDRLFYVTDTRNNLRFLVDTGAAISVLPVRDKARQQPFQLRLQAANGSSINTYGTKSLTLNIGMRRDFTWNFTVADVQMPILGADFLAHYDLAVRMNNHSLTDNLTRLCVLGTYSKLTTTGITVATCHNKEYLDLLNQYQDLLRPAGSIDSTKHQTQHFIKTTGQPVFSRSRRLAPNKLKFAKKAFDDMLREGVIRPSDSPYASPLHLVPKPGKEDYRICVDYRRLISITVRDPVTTPPVSSSFIQDLRLKMANLCYTPPRHCPSDIYLPHQLKDCEFVFVRNDSVKRLLTPAYTGPYRVLKRADKYFQIRKGIQTDNVSIDRLKPAFIEKPSSHTTSQSTPQVQEKFKTPVSLDKPKFKSERSYRGKQNSSDRRM
ncbi:unnamed protein product [Acanthosepion pharaonis]|uniref:Peptidase A2 domain-containing protein n=1 Tax=Acanthosepion pharaonis TaxID=158019 RepID=A0A812EJH2_ACAPH|nr:unnamed protein product [Sepia pharaonis]